MCSEFARDCTAMIPPCTTLDHTVNQMRLKCASGCGRQPTETLPASRKCQNHLQVIGVWPVCHDQPDGQMMVSG